VIFESQNAFRDILATHVTVDDEQRFVTGQNQNSGRETAQKMLAIVQKTAPAEARLSGRYSEPCAG
jgi:hypothetical protein